MRQKHRNEKHLPNIREKSNKTRNRHTGTSDKTTCYKKDNVVNHVSVGDKIEECSQGSGRMVPHVLELGHKLLSVLRCQL